MAKCIDKENGNCKFYITAEETGDEPGCANDGDVTNPELNTYCGEIDGDNEKEWRLKK